MRSRRAPRGARFGAFLAVGVPLALLLGWVLFGRGAAHRAQTAHAVRIAPSRIFVELAIAHATGRLARETYRLEDRSGISRASFRAEGRDGTAVEVATRPERVYDVAFAFERIAGDGAWQVVNKPPRGDVGTTYRLTIAQTAQGRSGSRVVSFTDPRYWAVRAGREYRIRLSRERPVPDLVRLSGTTLADPRYERLVADVRAFGDAEFRADVARARARARGLPAR